MDNLYNIEYGNISTQYAAYDTGEALEWFMEEFYDEIQAERKQKVNIYRVGYSVEGCDYLGTHDPDEVLTTITWYVEDLLCIMAQMGIELTDENIDKLLDNGLARILHESSVQDGWDIIGTLI